MRKKTVKNVCDYVFWYVLYLLPVVLYIVRAINAETLPTLEQFFVTTFGNVASTNVVYVALQDIFGLGGVFPVFESNALFYVFTYYVCVYIIHLAVDFLIFIPKIAHKWLDNIGGCE